MLHTSKTAPRHRGFTLIELMVVILILAILAALIVPRVVGRQDDAKFGKARNDLAVMSGLLEQFRVDCDRYPTSEEGLQALRSAPQDANNWKGPYTTKPIPTDPWGNPYIYEFPGPNGDDSYLLMSYGADGVEGGDGNNRDITAGTEE